MVSDTRQRTTLGSRFRFLIRIVGLTGVLAAGAGMVLSASAFPSREQWTPDFGRGVLEGSEGRFAQAALCTLVGGLIASGRLRLAETVVEGGLEAAPGAFIDMLRGRYLGKVVVKL